MNFWKPQNISRKETSPVFSTSEIRPFNNLEYCLQFVSQFWILWKFWICFLNNILQILHFQLPEMGKQFCYYFSLKTGQNLNVWNWGDSSEIKISVMTPERSAEKGVSLKIIYANFDVLYTQHKWLNCFEFFADFGSYLNFTLITLLNPFQYFFLSERLFVHLQEFRKVLGYKKCPFVSIF